MSYSFFTVTLCEQCEKETGYHCNKCRPGGSLICKEHKAKIFGEWITTKCRICEDLVCNDCLSEEDYVCQICKHELNEKKEILEKDYIKEIIKKLDDLAEEELDVIREHINN